ncbi:amidase domain-containing protein [Agromyces sp. NPDC058136]|uniref:amidase domain-containing protein n=1 Tax=Agromyces sp. NPDC058136 TaxID=3346354 RepID=UPI0036DDE758
MHHPSPAPKRRRALLVTAALTTALALGAGAVALGWVAATPESAPSAGGADDTVAAADETADGDSDGLELDWASLSDPVTAQMEYVEANWSSEWSDEFGFIDENDCMDFASQSLLARGWDEDEDWWYAVGDAYESSAAWRSSTAFMEYLEEHPEKATALSDAQRAEVKVGDIVQFDWDVSGDRDHTGIVTAVIVNDDGSVDIRYAGHTDATWDRSVDWSISEYHPGAEVWYWSIAD